MPFSKMHIFRAPIESEGPGMESSKFVKSPRALRGLDTFEDSEVLLIFSTSEFIQRVTLPCTGHGHS